MIGPDDLKEGGTYRAKRFREGLFGNNNDRTILYLNRISGVVQYDSDTVATGRHYPQTTIDAFVRWAKEEVPSV